MFGVFYFGQGYMGQSSFGTQSTTPTVGTLPSGYIIGMNTKNTQVALTARKVTTPQARNTTVAIPARETSEAILLRTRNKGIL